MWNPANKENYLAYHGIGGALWSLGYSRGRMCKELYGFPFEHMVEIDDHWFPLTTKDERYGASEYFRENFKTVEELKAQWEEVKGGKDDYQHTPKRCSSIPIFRIF